jgi:hypothetical protein
MTKSLKKILKLSIVAVIATAPTVNYAAYIPLSSSLDNYTYVYTQDLDIQKMAKIALDLQQQKSTFKTSYYIPFNGMPTYSSDGSHIANKIVKHTVQNWLDDETIDLQFIRQVQKLDEGLSAELPIGSATTTSKDAAKFKLRLRPVHSEAQIRYEGKFGANLSYNIHDETTRLQISWSF